MSFPPPALPSLSRRIVRAQRQLEASLQHGVSAIASMAVNQSRRPAGTASVTAPLASLAVAAFAAAFISLAPAVAAAPADADAVVFAASGNYTVPENVFFVNFSAWGAGGSGGSYYVGTWASYSSKFGSGGAGAFVNGTIAVIPGETLVVEVGQPAGGGPDGCFQYLMGNGCMQYSPGAGGGHSSVYRPGLKLSPLLVIGGGGGGSLNGGGIAAELPGYVEQYCGLNGNELGAGLGSVSNTNCFINGNSPLSGPTGGRGSFLAGGMCGGGSGYFGGGGGTIMGGGSGSSYADPTLLGVSGASSRALWNLAQDAAPASTSPYYNAALSVAAGGGPNKPGGPGLVVIAPTAGPPATLVTPSSTPTATATATATPTNVPPSPSQASIVCPTCAPCPAELVSTSPSASAVPSPSPTCRPDLAPERDHCRCRHTGDANPSLSLDCDPATDASWCPSRRPRPTCHPDLTNSDGAGTQAGASGMGSGPSAAVAGASPAVIAGACIASALLGAALHALMMRAQLRRSGATAIFSARALPPHTHSATAAASAARPGADGLGRAGVDWTR